MFKDFQKEELCIGDKVIFTLPNYRELRYGIITGFTKQKVYVEYGPNKSKYLAEPNFLVKAKVNTCG